MPGTYRCPADSGLYYLRSRYYNPKVGRFINADDTALLGATGTVLSYNLFAYCENNPVNRVDLSGLLWQEIGDWFTNTFGANSSTIMTTIEKEVYDIHRIAPITAKLGVNLVGTVSEYGDSSKPLSFYFKRELENPIKSSSAGLKINIGNFTLDISIIGCDNIGVSASITENNIIGSFGIKANLADLKIGLEESSTIITGKGAETTYAYFGLSGGALASIFVFATTGQLIRSHSYAYEYAY